MTKRDSLAIVCCLVPWAVAGCTKKEAPPAPKAAAPVVADRVDAGPPPIVGMEDPFARLTGDAAKSLKAGYKAMQAKKYDEARTAFAAVVSAVPDYSPARMQEIKAAALSGHAADIPPLWKDLLARDFVGYVGRLDKPRELAMLRGGPEWARIKAVETSVRSAYAADIGKGLFFLARSRDLGVSKAGSDMVKLAPNQELYQLDSAGKKYRRLTETEGHVFAYSVAPERKAISFLVVTNVADTSTPTPQFSEASVGAVDLATLETTGPLRLGAAGTKAATVVLGWTSQGDPVWTVRGATGEETNYALDATRTAAVVVATSGAVQGNRTTATPSSVSMGTAAAEQVVVAEDRKSLQIADEDRTLRATRELDPDTVVWAPAGHRLAYAGAFVECGAAGKPAKNELYLWERGKKTAARIATAPSAFRMAWLDDERLVYQSGAGKQMKLHVLDVATKKDSVLKPRSGAALAGFNGTVCPGAPPESDAEESDFDPEPSD
jgi:hypothetical protein